jgi:outer membrane protein TolC
VTLRLGGLISVATLICTAGCARFEPKPLSAERTSDALDSRSLEDAKLEQFLKRNAPHQIPQSPPQSWGLDLLTLAALYYNPSLEVARAQWAVARGGEKTAAQRPNPTLSVSPAYDTTTKVPSPWLVTATLDVPIETAGKRRYRRAQAAELSDAARWKIATAAWQVRSSVRASLLDLTAAQQRQQLLQAQLNLQQRVLEKQQQQVEAGAIAASTVLPVRIAVARAQLDLTEAKRLQTDARSRLAEAIGIPLKALDSAKVTFELEQEPQARNLTSENVRKTALQTRPDILAGLAEYAASQSALQLEIAKQYPDVHLQPGYEYDQGDNKWALGLSMELPVLHQNQGPIAEAKAKREEAAARFVALQAKLIAEIDRATAGYRVSQENVAALNSIAQTQAQRTQAIEAQVNAGAAEQLDLLNAQLEAAAFEITRLEARIKLQQSLGSLEDALQAERLPNAIFESTQTNAR